MSDYELAKLAGFLYLKTKKRHRGVKILRVIVLSQKNAAFCDSVCFELKPPSFLSSSAIIRRSMPRGPPLPRRLSAKRQISLPKATCFLLKK